MIPDDGSLPNRIPEAWKSELEPVLDADEQKTLRAAYARLEPKDEIRIVYSPRDGTRLLVSGRSVISEPGPRVMAAFLDIWLGQTPVSEEVKESLLRGLR